MTNRTERGIRMADSFVPLLCQFDKNYSDLAKRNGESYFDMWVLEEIGGTLRRRYAKAALRDNPYAQANGELPCCFMREARPG